jgi:hypothetical protein
MVFDNKPRKFQNERQRVSYAASYLSDIALIWSQPFLTLDPEPPIRGSWGIFCDELNRLFRQANIIQVSERAIRKLKMLDTHHVNRHMTNFAELSSYVEWNDAALYEAFYNSLAERIKDHILSVERPATLDELKHLALRIDNRYWARQGEKQITTSIRVPSSFEPSPAPRANIRSKVPVAAKPSEQKDLSGVLDATGRLTEVEKERRKTKGLCPYCGELPTQHAKGCCYQEPAPTTGRAIFTLEADPQVATLEGVPEEGEDSSSEN